MLKIRLTSIYFLIQVLCSNSLLAQEAETIIKSDFVIRDFCILTDSIFYIKKRDVFLYNRETKSSKKYFIGGYGLKIASQKNSNTIITASNELVDTISSVRFYNKRNSVFDAVFYYKKGKILDFLVIPEAKVFVLSLTNKKILFVDYKDSQEFYKTIEINLEALSRKLIYKNNILYYATDNGEVFKYNFHDYTKTLLHKGDNYITELVINKNILIYTTINGGFFKIDLKTNTKKKLKINNNFISTLMLFSDHELICGSWDGTIYILDINKFSLERELKFHNRPVLAIKKDKYNKIYSSSLDKTIKKWTLN